MNWCCEMFYYFVCFQLRFKWESIFVLREKAGLFIACISVLIDLYCLLSVGLFSCCSMVIEFLLSVRGKQDLGWGKYLWMSLSVPHSPALSLLFILPASCILTWLSSTFCLWTFFLMFPPSSGLHYCLCVFSKCIVGIYVNCSLTPRIFHTSVFAIFLSSAGTWAATWGPGNKYWCVREVWPGWPVAGSHQAAHQRGICPRRQSGPRGHLVRLCTQDLHSGGCV